MANPPPPTSSPLARSEPPIIGLSSTSQSQPLDESNPLSPTLDADPDIDMNIGTSPKHGDPEGGERELPPWENAEADEETEVKLPTKKDISLKEFLAKMDDYAPIVSATSGISLIFIIPGPIATGLISSTTCLRKANNLAPWI